VDIATQEAHCPDGILAGTKYVDPAQCLVIGDASCGVIEVSRVEMQAISLLSGGITEAELRRAGTVEIYRDVADLLEH
jgi:beta-phosphoglucomutase-like phosphatase (HAD superfamily)